MLRNDWNKEIKGVSLYTQESTKASFLSLVHRGLLHRLHAKVGPVGVFPGAHSALGFRNQD